MKEQILIYEVKSSAAVNSEKLFSQDHLYFYWNTDKFKNLNIGDFVFVVNTNSHWVLFSKLDKVNIITKEENGKSYFNDIGENYEVSGTYKNFIRLHILKKMEVPIEWKWKSLGSSETAYLNGTRVGLQSAENRIQNIDQLKQLTDDESISEILENCRANFNKGLFKYPPTKTNQKLNQNRTIDMSILTAIKTKPFILLAGISGTGKSRLVRTLAYKTCSKNELKINLNKPGNFELIPVRPNWHDSSELMGYISRISGEKYITTSFLQFIAKAWRNVEVPFFLCLDEMNLAPVEQYFAEYLSIIETRQVQNNLITTDYLISKDSFENQALYIQLIKDIGLENDTRFTDGLSIPANLVVIGTVNMDETTHSFSRKVLDRAMTFEMNDVDLNAGLDNSKNDWSYPSDALDVKDFIGIHTAGSEVVGLFKESKKVIEFLQKINNELEGTPFKIAYRVRDEFLIYCYYASLNPIDNWFNKALDEMVSLKILSRIEGDEAKTGTVLKDLQRIINSNFKKSNAKLIEMESRLVKSGYTSYWS